MAFALNSDITLGEFKRIKPNAIIIKKSLFEYVDTATIKLPITARIRRGNEVVTASADTAKQFFEGDFVQIKLGYNGVLNTEFEGFISRLNFTAPVEVECEGYSYLLRKKTYLKTFVKTELVEILKYLVSGTAIKLVSSKVPSFKIDKLVLDNCSGTEALEKIKKVSNNLIRIFFDGPEMFANLLYNVPRADVRFCLGWNVIKDDDLKLREAKNQNVIVNYIGEKKDGSKTSVKAGNKGEVKIYKSHAVTDEASLKTLAEAKRRTLSFDGYEGKIVAFGTPFCQPGYRVLLEDRRYQERSGNYLIESIEVSYSMAGFRRKIGIGAKL